LAVCAGEPHAFGRATLEGLQILARQVVTRLELYAKGGEQERVLRSRQRVERALTIERNFVAAVLDTISALVLVLDTAGRIVRFNRASERISGYGSADLVGRAFPEELFHSEDRERAIRMFERARAGRLDESREINWHSKQGLRRISWTATSLTNAQGEVGFIIMTGVDVTEQRAAEDALGSSETRYRQLVENSLGVVSTHDLDGNLLSINTHAAESLGYKPEELIGTPLRNLIDEPHLAEYDTYLEQIQRQREQQGLFYLKRRDGRVATIAYRNRLLELPDAPAFVLSHGIDITEQTQAEEELHALMRQHESILESVGDGIWGMDLEGRLSFVNRSGARMLGYRQEELTGRDAHALVHRSQPDGSPHPLEACPILSSLRSETPRYVNDDLFWRRDGTSFPVEYVVCPLINRGRLEGTVVAFQDVTERRRLERMKDEFIATVSHELRTPLTSLRGALGLIAAGALEKRPEKVPQMLDIAIGNCDRLVRLVNDIVDFEHIGSGDLKLEKKAWNVFDLLRRAVDSERSGATRAGLRFRIDAQPADVWADGERILQTLGNLIRNAIQFSEKGGEIRLGASITSETEVTFEVQDHGRGISPENLEIIFNRFQQGDSSDSRASGGTGLGLAMCRSIVEHHGGRIWATSSPGSGSTFHFTVERFIVD
jgi:PAS domain S-box-containing protein